MERNGFWRLDGVGSIRLPSDPKAGMTAEFYFSEIAPTKINTPYKKDAITGKHFSLALNIVYMRLIPTGSVLSTGNPITPPPFVGSYTIDTNAAKHHLRSDEISLNGTTLKEIIPDAYLHSPPEIKEHLNQAQLTIVPIIGIHSPQYLIIPDTELFKYYYGVGSTTLKSVLNGTVDSIYNHEKSHTEEEITTIYSDRNLSKLELSTIARWRNSATARSRMFSIRNHIVARHSSKSIFNSDFEPHIKAPFPFNGHTTLSVCGKKIRLESANGTAPIWAVFVMRIQSCTHGFGCKKVRQIFEHSAKSKPSTTPQGEINPHPFLHLPKCDFSDLPVEDIPANIDLQRIHRGDGFPIEYPALSDVQFEKVYLEGSETTHVPTGRILTDIGVLTVEDGSTGEDSTGRGVDGYDEEISALSKNLELFLLCIKAINDKGPIYLEPIGFGSSRKYKENKIYTFKGPNNRIWCRVQDGITWRSRHIIIAEIATGLSQYLYLIEMETPPNKTGQCSIIIHKTDYSKLDEITFNDYLLLTAHQYYWATEGFHSTRPYYNKIAEETFNKIKVIKVRHPNKVDGEPANPEEEAIRNSKYIERWKNIILNKIELVSQEIRNIKH